MYHVSNLRDTLFSVYTHGHMPKCCFLGDKDDFLVNVSSFYQTLNNADDSYFSNNPLS